MRNKLCSSSESFYFRQDCIGDCLFHLQFHRRYHKIFLQVALVVPWHSF